MSKEYGCKKHKLSFEDFWDKTNDLIESDNFCPDCIKNVFKK